jgi:RHS repeat-associated protein
VAYTFDYGNRLREVAGQENYFYDAYGRRVQATASANGQSILSMYTRDGRLIYQDDQRASAKHDYLYLGRQLVEVVDHGYGGGNAMRYQHADAQGSIVAQTNATPGIIERTAYSSWGAPLNHDNDDEPGYTGQLQDSLTGLTYMQQRYYDPEAGRFLSADPVQTDDKGGNFNRYWYASDSPYRYMDPDGRQTTGEYIDQQAQAAADSGNDVATYAWAFAGTAWKYLGAEGLSQVVDKGSAASTSDKVGAALAVAAVLPVGRVAEGIADAAKGISTSDHLIQAAGKLTRLKGGVQQGRVEGDAKAILKSITSGGKKVSGGRIEMPDKTIIGSHTSTKTGVHTIDINKGGKIYKIRIDKPRDH